MIWLTLTLNGDEQNGWGQKGLQEGRQEGLKEGLKEGLAQGAKQNAIESAKKFLQMETVTPEQIAQGTGLTLEEVLALKKE